MQITFRSYDKVELFVRKKHSFYFIPVFTSISRSKFHSFYATLNTGTTSICFTSAECSPSHKLSSVYTPLIRNISQMRCTFLLHQVRLA